MNKEQVHPLGLGNCSAEYLGQDSRVYTDDELDIKLTHVPPVTFIDKLAYFGVRVIRLCFDTVSLWNFGEITQNKVFRRVIFLETVAAIPGFVAAMVRHFKSLRTFSRDGGMMQMFLDEANNERMHLLTFVRMKNPSHLARALVLVSQTVVGAGFFIVYNISPDLCHRFVGYVGQYYMFYSILLSGNWRMYHSLFCSTTSYCFAEEEACHTYTDIIKCIEEAPEGTEMANWRTEKAPSIARGYWRLGEEGTVLDMMYAIRADEAEHRDVNHECSGMKEGQINPLYNPQEKFDEMLMQYAQTIMKRDAK